MGIFDGLFNSKTKQESIRTSQLGIEKYDRKDFDGAIQDFTKAINIHPENQDFYIMRGTAYESLGIDSESEKDFRKALQLDPKSFVASYRLGMFHYRKEDLKNAIKMLRVSYENYPVNDFDKQDNGNSKILFVSKRYLVGNLGNFLIKEKIFEEGLDFLEKAINADVNNPNSYVIKGMTLAEMGRKSEGILYIKKAIKLGSPSAEMALKALEQFSDSSSETQNDEEDDLELEFVFNSSDHIRFENGRQVSGPHGGAPRAIKVEANITGNEGYTVTMYNTDSGRSVVQMAPKQMKMVVADNEKIVLKGYGRDATGEPFSDYGLTILHENGITITLILHMFDRGVDIQYLL